MAKDSDDVAENVKQGFGLLWKAAKKAASDVKREVTATTVSKTIEDAGREIARAAGNVADKVGSEIKKIQPKDPDYAGPEDPRMKPPYEAPDEGKPGDGKPGDGKPGGGKPGGGKPAKPKGPTPSDPGFRIAIDDDDKR